METVLITGGTGLFGKHLSRKLKEKGYKVALLSRTSNTGPDLSVYTWNPEKNIIDPQAISKADYIIHLAGAGIGNKRWTKKRRELIITSRVRTCELLFKTVSESGGKLKAFISASGIGYYGAETSDKIFSETDQPSCDFIGDVCRQWEQSADRFGESGIRTVKLRTGIVLTGTGGALGRMIITVKLGIGSALGSGRQYIPWIHIDDLCRIYIKAIEDPSVTGAWNAVAPEHKTNREFMRTLAKILEKPFFFPSVPSFVIKLMFGKMSEILLNGSRVSADKIILSGFAFKFPSLENALRDLFPKI
ncbi:MAG: TIGR01777 family protein [Bacteroidia bacterium]|nr:MAG: TIGR01777 family protein [Bacteroidia bacterium]